MPCFQAWIYTGFHHFTEIGQIFRIINKFLIKKKLFNLKSGKWLVWITQKPRKRDFGESNSKKYPNGNRSVFILDPLLASQFACRHVHFKQNELGKSTKHKYSAKSPNVYYFHSEKNTSQAYLICCWLLSFDFDRRVVILFMVIRHNMYVC